MQRRGFIGALLAAGLAPAIVKAESLMQLAAPARYVLQGGVLVPAQFAGMTVQLRGRNWWWDKQPLTDGEIIFRSPRSSGVVTSFVIFDKDGHFVSKGGLNLPVGPGDMVRLDINPREWLAADL